MKNSPKQKRQAKSKSAPAHAAHTQPTATAMTVQTALTYFDFSQFPPEPIATAAQLDSSFVQYIGDTIVDGIAEAFQQNDTPTFVKCYQALHFCLGLDMESHRMNFLSGNGKLAMLMTAYQAAILFNRVNLATALFDACIASPHHPIRKGISTPVTMITYAYSVRAKSGAPADQAAWLKAVDYMIAKFVDHLIVVDPNELCPTTGVIFALLQGSQSGDTLNAISHMCTAMTIRHGLLIAQGINNPPATDSKHGSL
jgi:hypothetical protein